MDCTRADAPWCPEKTKTVARGGTEPISEPMKEVGIRTKPIVLARVEPTLTEPIVPASVEPERQNRESHRNVLSEPRIFEKTNTKKEFPYGKLIAGILIADAIAIIALISVNRSVRHERVDADAPRVTSAVVTTVEETSDDLDENLDDLNETSGNPDETFVDTDESAENPEDLLKARYSGKLPVDGMPVSCLEYTSIGAPTKVEKCKLYDSMDVHRRYKILHWYNSEGQTWHTVSLICRRARQARLFTRLQPIGRPSFAPPLKPSGSSDSSGGSLSVRDDYDSPEDFWEDNMDAFEDEDEAFDYWYDD